MSKKRADLAVRPLLRHVEEARLKWYGHVMRMEETRLAKRHLQWKPRGRRPVGRPRKRWFDVVKEALLKRGKSLTGIEEEGTYENRDTWKEVVRCSPTDR